MSYAINIEINGFVFQFGEMGYQSNGIGCFVSFSDQKIKEAIESENPELNKAIKELLNQSQELDALYTMTHFTHYQLQGNDWRHLKDYYSFNSLQKFSDQASIVLKSKHADERQINTAKTLLDVLNGTYIAPPPIEKSPEQKARSSFEKKRDKLRLKLVIRDTYKCVDCGMTKDNSLCIAQKVKDSYNYELDNLILRCRGCLNRSNNKK